jgi:hypothetical protein
MVCLALPEYRLMWLNSVKQGVLLGQFDAPNTATEASFLTTLSGLSLSRYSTASLPVAGVLVHQYNPQRMVAWQVWPHR